MAMILGKVSFFISQTLLIQAPLLSSAMILVFGRGYLAVGMVFMSFLNQEAEFDKPTLKTGCGLCL